ncbi:MAG: hypothetical protein AAGG75_21015 [Bacteroidota bacterium]
MKISVFFFAIMIYLSLSMLLFVGCVPQSLDSGNCHFRTTETKSIIEFTEENAQTVRFSPFEKNKVIVEFQNSEYPTLEFDLITKDTQVLEHKHWKKIYSSSGPVYYDKKNAVVWIGGPDRNLLRYDQKIKEAKFLPIKYVTRIVPCRSKIYFVASHGLYIKGTASEEIRKVNDLPLEGIKRSQLLDEKTLILDSKITYDLESKTWRNGIQLYKREHTYEGYPFKAKSGIGIFQEKDNLFYSTSSDVKELKISNRLSNVKIDYPYIYGRRKNKIDRLNTETEGLTTFEYRLPKVNGHSPNFSYDDNIIWIHRPGQLYFINTISGQSHNFSIQENEHFKSMIYDDCHIYLLYAKKIEIWEKTAFIQNCPIFNIADYLAEFQDFKNFVDSTKISEERNASNVVFKLKSIEERYANSTHPEILAKVKHLGMNAFNNIEYETDADFQRCYKNEILPKEQRIKCFQTLIDSNVSDLNFTQVLKYDDDFKSLFEADELERISYFCSSIDSIRSYVAYRDSISEIEMSADSIEYFKAIALNRICNTIFFCHGGCGGCNYSLVVNALKKFNSKYPTSLLIDNSEFAILDYQYMYEDSASPRLVADFERFKVRHPDSDILNEVDFGMLMQLMHSDNKKNEVELIEKLENFKKSYPEDTRIKDIDQWIRELRK